MKHCHRAIRMNTWIFYAKCVMLLSCWNWDHLQGKFKRAGLFQKIGYIGRYVPGLSSYVKKVFLNTYASYEIQMASQFIEWVVFKQHRLSQKNYSCVTIRLLWIVLEWRNMLFYYMLNCPLMHVAIRGPHSQRRLLIGSNWGKLRLLWVSYESTKSHWSKSMITSRSSFRFWSQANKPL